MCSTQSVLALLALYVGLAHSFDWDIVLARDKELRFKVPSITTSSVLVTISATPLPSCYMNWITYDPVHNRVLFSKQFYSNTFVYSYDIATQNTESYSKKTPEHYLENFAYDPTTELLFGTKTNSIYSFLLKPGSNNEVNGNEVVNLEKDKTQFRDVAVNGYGRYIYWITDSYKIERARINGTGREVVIDSNGVIRQCLTIDAYNIYWIENQENDDYEFFVQTADLQGNNRKTLYSEKQWKYLVPELMAVSKDFIYWGDSIEKFFWQLPKNSNETNLKAQKILIPWDIQGIAINYKIEEQNDSAAASPLCLHGTTVSGKSVCECAQGYTGERCEVSVCHNYCLRGDCSVSAEGQPTCRCNVAYSGERCEANICQGHCSNNGICSLNNSEPVCECTAGYGGGRCNVSVCQNYCVRGDCSVTTEGQPKCRCKAGYSGDRCEANACQKHCLNSGVCSLNEAGEPVCQCAGGYQGDRCDVPVFLTKCFQTVTSLKDVLKRDVTSMFLGKGVNATCASTVV